MSVINTNHKFVDSWRPLGQALLDHLDGEEDLVILNKSVFGAFEVPVSIYFRDWNAFPSLETFALSLCTGKVLDIGAGSGCHALALQEEKLEVTALEISPLNVEVMKKRGVNRIVHADIFRYQKEKFDTLLLLMNGIGVAGTLGGLENFLTHAHKLLKVGGRLIFDSTNLLIDHPKAHTTNNKVEYFGSVEYTMVYKGMIGKPFKWLFVDEIQLEKASRKSGWKMQKIFEDEDGHYLVQLTPLV